MRRHAARKTNCHLVEVAQAPSFGRIIALNNRVAKSVLWRDDWENHHSTRHSRMCGRDADEPKHRWSSDTPRNLARSVSRHEYLLDEYKNGPLAGPPSLLLPAWPPNAPQTRRPPTKFP